MSTSFRSLTPAQAESLFAQIDALGGNATALQLAQHLEMSLPQLRPILGEVLNRGLLRECPGVTPDRTRYARGLALCLGLVCSALRAPLLEMLKAGPEGLSTLAVRLGVPLPVVEATGLALAQEGEVCVSFVGAMTLLRRVAPVVPVISDGRQALWFERPATPLFAWKEATLPRVTPALAPRTDVPLEAHDLVGTNVPEVAPVPVARPLRPYVTLAMEEELRRLLPPAQRRQPGVTARVATRFGLSVAQVRSALARLPVEVPCDDAS